MMARANVLQVGIGKINVPLIKAGNLPKMDMMPEVQRLNILKTNYYTLNYFII